MPCHTGTSDQLLPESNEFCLSTGDFLSFTGGSSGANSGGGGLCRGSMCNGQGSRPDVDGSPGAAGFVAAPELEELRPELILEPFFLIWASNSSNSSGKRRPTGRSVLPVVGRIPVGTMRGDEVGCESNVALTRFPVSDDDGSPGGRRFHPATVASTVASTFRRLDPIRLWNLLSPVALPRFRWEPRGDRSNRGPGRSEAKNPKSPAEREPRKSRWTV